MTKSAESQRGHRKQRRGVVVSDAQDKTIVVRVDHRMVHPLYGKEMTRSKKHYAHDPDDEARAGDRVEITETRPRSKSKRWRLSAILQKAVSE